MSSHAGVPRSGAPRWRPALPVTALAGLTALVCLTATGTAGAGEPRADLESNSRIPRLGLAVLPAAPPSAAPVSQTLPRTPEPPEPVVDPAPADDGMQDEAQAPPAPPTELLDHKRARRFRRSVKKLLRRSPLGRVKVGIVVADARTGAEVFRQNPDRRFNPASTLKLFTGATALAVLGPNRRFTTAVYAVDDTLILVGDGDPMLMADDLERLARATAAATSETRFRRLVIDTSVFGGRDLPPGYDKKSTDASYRAATGALAIDYGAALVRVTPTRDGRAPEVTITPPGKWARRDLRARTVIGKGSTIRIQTFDRGDETAVSVTGRIGERRRRGSAARRRVSSPVMTAAHAFAWYLRKAGVRVGSVERDTAGHELPDDAQPLATHRSARLSEITAAMNKHSNNFIAEMLVRNIGRKRRARGATWKDGRQIVNDFLARQVGLEGDGFRYRNGSGLYDGGRFTPRQVVRLLVAMDRHPQREPFRTSLAVAGGTGTLEGRLKGPRYRGRLIGKTGTLNDVSALSGYARGRSGTLYAFSVMMNETNKATPAMRRVQDQLGALIIDLL